MSETTTNVYWGHGIPPPMFVAPIGTQLPVEEEEEVEEYFVIDKKVRCDRPHPFCGPIIGQRVFTDYRPVWPHAYTRGLQLLLRTRRFFPQQWPRSSLVLIAQTHGGRLSSLDDWLNDTDERSPIRYTTQSTWLMCERSYIPLSQSATSGCIYDGRFGISQEKNLENPCNLYASWLLIQECQMLGLL